MVLSAADLLLWTRCRRQWARAALRDGRRRPILPSDMVGEANLRETARVIELGIDRFAPEATDASEGVLDTALGPPVTASAVSVLDEQCAEQWLDNTRRALAGARRVKHALVQAGELNLLVDALVWHPKLEGWIAYLFRPATGFRGSYAVEAAAVSWVFSERGLPLAELQLVHLNKSFTREEEPLTTDTFRLSNARSRAGKRTGWVASEIAELVRSAESGGAVDDWYRCRQGCSLCIPRDRATIDRFDVYSLHKGSQLARELVADGITDIRRLDPAGKKLSAKQRIQIQAVLSGKTHVEPERLASFLDSLHYPISYLDFEAYSQSLPPFRGLKPYEHAPVIASVHRRVSPEHSAEATSFAAEPGRDRRAELFSWLEDVCAGSGSIVVFSKGFEAAMVRQAAAAAGQKDAGEEMVSRMVDLLLPFLEFVIYHPDQLGKVSLKRVLPAFTDANYADSPVQDGMHANLSYTRLADRRLAVDGPEAGIESRAAIAAEAVSEAIHRSRPNGAGAAVTTEQIVDYCAVDTMAMVHLIERLSELSAIHRLPEQ